MNLDEKKLTKQRTVLQQQITELDNQVSVLQRTRRSTAKELSKVQQRLETLLSKKPILITDHAYLRFIERHGLLDLEEVRQQLLTPQLQQWVDTLGGNGTYPVADGQVVLKNYNVVTYIIPD